MAIFTSAASGSVGTWSGTPSIVGSAPQYDDASDSTYAQHTTFGNGSDPFSSKRQDTTRCTLDTPPAELGDPDQTTLNSITIRMRYKATISTGAGSVVNLGGVIVGTPGVDIDTPGFDLDLTTDNAIHDLTYLLDESDYSGNDVTILSMVQQMIAGDEVLLRANMAFGTNNTRNLWVYEFALDIDYDVVAQPGKPIRRIYPRDDRNRVYPPSRSRSSNRPNGYL